jgi:ribosomal protein S18 acetylase RimI-like enzyme
VDVISTGYRTDLMIRRLEGSTVTSHPGRIVVRTDTNPTYWWGNYLLLPGTALAATPDDLLALHEAEFPHATHAAIGINAVTDNPAARARFSASGWDASLLTIMTAPHLNDPPHPAPHINLRPLTTDNDYAQLAAVRHADQAASGRDPDPGFLRARLAAQRAAAAETAQGAWLGAFRDGHLLACLGVFSDGQGVARYQDVVTHPAARRQGLAGTLVCHAATYARSHLNARTLVMAADPAGPAIGIYRSLGFTGDETQLTLELVPRPTRPPPAASLP